MENNKKNIYTYSWIDEDNKLKKNMNIEDFIENPQFDNIEKLIEFAITEYKEIKEYYTPNSNCICIVQVEPYEYVIDTENILDDIYNNIAYEYSTEIEFNYLEKDFINLQKELSLVFNDWIDKTNNRDKFFKFKELDIINIKERVNEIRESKYKKLIKDIKHIMINLYPAFLYNTIVFKENIDIDYYLKVFDVNIDYDMEGNINININGMDNVENIIKFFNIILDKIRDIDIKEKFSFENIFLNFNFKRDTHCISFPKYKL